MKRFALAFAAVLLASSCREEPYVTSYAAPAPAEHQKEVREWQAKRLQRLQAPDSWLTLVGLFWLNEGPNDVTLHNAQKVHLVRSGTNATLEPYAPMTVDGKPLSGPTPLRNDAEKDGPTIVQMGSVRFQVIKRGERLGLRVKDAQSPTRTHFLGLTYFPISEKWRVVARFEPYTPTKKIPITDVTGMTSNMESPGALVFEIDGKEYRIDPVLEEGEEDLFIIFRDKTSADETYPAARYLYAAKPGPDGRVIVDFNKAYNPPCAFTSFATCPLPPPQNRLPFRIEAGEKRYAGGHV